MNSDMYSSKLENRQYVTHPSINSRQTYTHSSLYKFKDIEDVIQLAQRIHMPFFDTQLFRFEHLYYLVVKYPEQRAAKSKDWTESIILEYGERSTTSIHRIEEYGKRILSENAIGTICEYFTYA